jgi:hypothetical protein
LEDGKDPFTGEVISVKDQFQLRSKTDCLIVHAKEKDGAYVPRVVRGPRMCAATTKPSGLIRPPVPLGWFING